jgi:hypothetical protein
MRKWPAARAWLSRGKIWDDVFSRTVSILISSAIIGLFLTLSGAIHPSRNAWAAIATLAVAIASPFGIFALDQAADRTYERTQPKPNWLVRSWTSLANADLTIFVPLILTLATFRLTLGNWGFIADFINWARN